MTWEKLGVELSNRFEHSAEECKKSNLGPSILSMRQASIAINMIGEAIGIKNVDEKTDQQVLDELSRGSSCIHEKICKHFEEA